MKSKLITFLCMGLYLVGCGNNDPMNSLYNSELTEAENQLLKCSKKNRAALKESLVKSLTLVNQRSWFGIMSAVL